MCLLAGIMHKFSTAVPQSSTLTALCDPQAGTPWAPRRTACSEFGDRPRIRGEFLGLSPNSVPELRTRLAIAAPAALRDENLCIIRASLNRTPLRINSSA